MLPVWFIGVAICIRLASGVSYVAGVLKDRAKPNPLTWFFWGLTPMIAFAAQLHEHVGAQAWVTFALGLSPIVVFILAVIKQRGFGHLDRFSISCGVVAVLGIVLWQVTDNVNMATVFSILADMFSGLPTFIKAYKNPSSEYAVPFWLSSLAMGITLLTITDWSFTALAFPLYMCSLNSVLAAIIQFRIGERLARRDTLAAQAIPE